MPAFDKHKLSSEKSRERKRIARAVSKTSRPAAPASSQSALLMLAAVAAVASVSRSPSVRLAESPALASAASAPAPTRHDDDGQWEIGPDQFHLLEVAWEDVVLSLQQSRGGPAAGAGAAAAAAAAASANAEHRPLATHFRPFNEDGDGSCFFHGIARNHLGSSALQFDVRRIMHQHATRNAAAEAHFSAFLAGTSPTWSAFCASLLRDGTWGSGVHLGIWAHYLSSTGSTKSIHVFEAAVGDRTVTDVLSSRSHHSTPAHAPFCVGDVVLIHWPRAVRTEHWDSALLINVADDAAVPRGAVSVDSRARAPASGSAASAAASSCSASLSSAAASAAAPAGAASASVWQSVPLRSAPRTARNSAPPLAASIALPRPSAPLFPQPLFLRNRFAAFAESEDECGTQRSYILSTCTAPGTCEHVHVLLMFMFIIVELRIDDKH